MQLEGYHIIHQSSRIEQKVVAPYIFLVLACSTRNWGSHTTFMKVTWVAAARGLHHPALMEWYALMEKQPMTLWFHDVAQTGRCMMIWDFRNLELLSNVFHMHKTIKNIYEISTNLRQIMGIGFWGIIPNRISSLEWKFAQYRDIPHLDFAVVNICMIHMIVAYIRIAHAVYPSHFRSSCFIIEIVYIIVYECVSVSSMALFVVYPTYLFCLSLMSHGGLHHRRTTTKDEQWPRNVHSRLRKKPAGMLLFAPNISNIYIYIFTVIYIHTLW